MMTVRMIHVEVIRAWPRHHVTARLMLSEGATAADALVAAQSAVGLGATEVPALAIFGERIEPGHVLRDGDRVELLRALTADPKDARRRRAGQTAKR